MQSIKAFMLSHTSWRAIVMRRPEPGMTEKLEIGQWVFPSYIYGRGR